MAEMEGHKEGLAAIKGFDGDTAEELAENIHKNLIDKLPEGWMFEFGERHYFQPAFAGGKYGAILFYRAYDPAEEEKRKDAQIAAAREKAENNAKARLDAKHGGGTSPRP